MYVRIFRVTMLLALAAATFGCRVPVARTGLPVSHNLPPAQMLAEPGPGVGGPGPGVMAPMPPAQGCMPGGGPGFGPAGMGSSTVQVIMRSPSDAESMQVFWDVTGAGQYDSAGAQTPVRQNFVQGGVYRLKLSDIPGREGLTLYPTMEIGPGTPRTAAYLEHAAVPVQFTAEDFDQVTAGNFVTKVIYVPDPEFQELALAGVDTLVSTRMDPGVDPIVEADRRGAILAVIRMGNKNMEMPGLENGDGMMGGGNVGMGYGAPPRTAGYVSGVTGPSYGMPYTGTQIGLPGPPHVPLGGPAGLQRYTLHNHTATHIPGPTNHLDVHVQQRPGLSYPRPANKVIISEQTMTPPHYNTQPPADMLHMPACGNPGCTGCGVCGG
jgi:hypothetical protein